MVKKKILVLGAGLAGLSTAWHLQRKNIDCRIFEKEEDPGGLCRSKSVNGFTFDCDGHLLHFKSQYVFKLIRHLLGNNLVKHERSAWIYTSGKFTRYPFQVNLYGLPAREIQECLLGFIQTSCRDGLKKQNNSFLSWINQTFGRGIAKHFMIPYNTKFWTVPPQRLTCDWLDGFIPVPSLSQIIEGSIEESKRQFGYNSTFWYPRTGGINQIALAFAGQTKNVYLNNRVTEINLVKKEIKTAWGIKEKFDYLVSTIPLPEMPYIIKGVPNKIQSLFKDLKWNSIFNLNLGIDKINCSGKHWIYFPHKEISFFRVGFPHNFSKSLSPPDKDSLYAEIAYPGGKIADRDKMTSQIKNDLKKIGLISEQDKIFTQDINDIKYGYPIYDKNYRKSREGILNFFTQNHIYPCGRYGSWRYMSMEQTILEGMNLANSIYENNLAAKNSL